MQQVSGIANADWTGTDPLAWVSEEYRRLYGLPAGQERVTVDEWLALVHEDDRERVAGQMRDLAKRAARSRLSSASTGAIVRRDGWLFAPRPSRPMTVSPIA